MGAERRLPGVQQLSKTIATHTFSFGPDRRPSGKGPLDAREASL
jgi:hypothetical protein